MTQDTRGRLVAVAAELLDRGGPGAVTLREVGKAAGVSHNAPYKHFASKEDLLAAIASRELERQAKTISATGSRKKPIDALRRLMHGYTRWARTYPARFTLTFGAWTHDSQELGEAATHSRTALLAMVKAAQAARELPSGNPDRMASLVLAMAHGAADLAIGGHLSKTGKGSADPEQLVDDLIKLLRTRAKNQRQ